VPVPDEGTNTHAISLLLNRTVDKRWRPSVDNVGDGNDGLIRVVHGFDLRLVITLGLVRAVGHSVVSRSRVAIQVPAEGMPLAS
jgi:hypothetical protein